MYSLRSYGFVSAGLSEPKIAYLQRYVKEFEKKKVVYLHTTQFQLIA